MTNRDGSIERRRTRMVRVGGVALGGGRPVAIQSMTNTDTRDVRSTVAQIRRLAKAGCEIVRLAVPDAAAAAALAGIRRRTDLPLVADIHFDHRLALAALDAGVDKLRINPGNIGPAENVWKVVKAAKARNVPIRIGVNAGSLERDILRKHGHPTAAGMVESALRHVRLLERAGFGDIVLSLKGSDVPMTIAAYRLAARACRYPLHLGITEAGTAFAGAVRSAVGIGALLAEGIGDTIRVSLCGDPVKEIAAARLILQSLDLRVFGPTVIACPTCGRCQIDVERIARRVEAAVRGMTRPLRIAVMGCAVNGPGEARQADVGICGGQGRGAVIRKGKVVATVRERDLVPALLREIGELGNRHSDENRNPAK
ncbi:MAG: flavodoxin-dependent (E)-4-hydroxy-3-methylbut-2-enyl-diphosphate synthase [Candidatus Edwardsbacteria bacterium]|nr:flavodoxin-dependent (E)-4-hydroxy-3-methylbut-2-enyl-diphosphate synthase [Candidatus Edwardsbacteria bacterium]